MNKLSNDIKGFLFSLVIVSIPVIGAGIFIFMFMMGSGSLSEKKRDSFLFKVMYLAALLNIIAQPAILFMFWNNLGIYAVYSILFVTLMQIGFYLIGKEKN